MVALEGKHPPAADGHWPDGHTYGITMMWHTFHWFTHTRGCAGGFQVDNPLGKVNASMGPGACTRIRVAVMQLYSCAAIYRDRRAPEGMPHRTCRTVCFMAGVVA